MKDIFITGIGTDIGKTITSAIFVEALRYDYWKPLQCGNLEMSDKKVVSGLIQNPVSKIHAETFRFKTPASPNIAAQAEKRQITLKEFHRPPTENSLIIEGAGGVLVPLNEKEFIIDMSLRLNCRVVVVTKNYVGSINHTLLTLEALASRGCETMGLVFNGEANEPIENSILNFTGLPKLLHIYPEKKIDKKMINKYAAHLELPVFA